MATNINPADEAQSRSEWLERQAGPAEREHAPSGATPQLFGDTEAAREE
jgi:hypothetical protein